MDLSQLLNNQYVVLAIAAAASLLIPQVRGFLQKLLTRVNPSAPPLPLPADPGPLPTSLAGLLPWLLNQLIPQMRQVVKEELAIRPPVAGSTPAQAVAVVNNPDGSTTVQAPGVSVTSAAVKVATVMLLLIMAGTADAGLRRRCYCPPVQTQVRSQGCQCGANCNCQGCCCDRPGARVICATGAIIASPVIATQKIYQGVCGAGGCCR